MKAIKTKHLWLMAALVCGLGLTVTSCKEDNELSAEEQEQQAEQEMDQAATFWNVVGQLTDDIMPAEGWQTATYAPAIGLPDGNNDAVRIVSCADDETAAQHFADLVGLTMGDGFDESTMDYTYTNDLIGSLHFYKVFGKSLAIVDVDIKQIPGLSQIVYKSPEQMQENGSFSGTAYYRFGDVVSKQNADGQWDYWICVRPCFGPDGKGDSHWISLSKLPSTNVKTQTKTANGVEHTLVIPKSLATKQNHMQNFAELVYAMTDPATWASNLKANYSKLKFFTDMSYKKNYQYNNQYFFQNVSNAWSEKLYKDVFGLTKEELRQELQQNGLNLVYNSASISGNNISLPVASYSGTNLKTRVLTKKTSEWKTKGFNIYDLTKKGYMEFRNLAGGTEKAWVVRYATGATLAKGSRENPVFDKYKRLPNCTDVFVYNIEVEKLDMEMLKNIAPKITNAGQNESTYYHLGDIIRYGGRYYVCVDNHAAGDKARFVTLNDQETHATMTFPWKKDNSVEGSDVVYGDNMASAETLAAWLANILIDDDMCEKLRRIMTERNATGKIKQIVPEDDDIREDFMGYIIDDNLMITNVNHFSRIGVDDNHIFPYQWEILHKSASDDGNDYDVWRVAPKGYLLCDKLIYNTHLIQSTDHWVPYLFCMKDGDAYKYGFKEMTETDDFDQNNDYFKWKHMGTYQIKGKLSSVVSKPFHILKIAMYWDHTTTEMSNTFIKCLLDFTKDWLKHPVDDVRQEMMEKPNAWTNMNITSREITFTDNGQRQTQYESVYVKSEEE